MKNLLSYIVLGLCIILYAVSLSEPLTKKIATYKYQSKSVLRSDKYRYGDLFGMSYYPGIRTDSAQLATYPRERCDSTKKMVDLYGLCDSYIWSMLPSDTFYCNVNKLKLATLNRFDRLKVQLDTTKANILLIEFSERNTMFMVQDQFTYITEFLTVGDTAAASPGSTSDQGISGFLFNKNINSNLEFNIFETALFTGIKKLKASINFDFLKTPHQDVAVSPDKKYMLYQPTIDPSLGTSSFKNVSDTEIDSVVNKLNRIYLHYKNIGFREVYFSMIPNPVSILYPEYKGYKYNNIILRIQDHPSLKIPVIDIYADFKKAGFPVYQQTDSHWNKNGAFLWLNKFNNKLRNIEM